MSSSSSSSRGHRVLDPIWIQIFGEEIVLDPNFRTTAKENFKLICRHCHCHEVVKTNGYLEMVKAHAAI
jgi:hypothetical protein